MNPLPLEIDCAALSQLRRSGEEFLLLDVRTPDEHATARIDGAMLLPMQEIGQRLNELEPYRHTRLVVHCHHGGRSLRVTHFLQQQGFTQVQNLSGGIDAWSEQIDPTVPRY
jgi:rhodanese-related sulfurtransferase